MPSNAGPDDQITWEQPPEVLGRKPSKWQPIADQLRRNPGKWARVVTQGNISIGGQARNAELICFRPAGSFEARTVNFTSRFTGDVYLRYIGENGEYK